MQIILAGSAKLYQMVAQFGLGNYWLAAAEILNGANGGAWRRLRGLVPPASQAPGKDDAMMVSDWKGGWYVGSVQSVQVSD